MMDCKDCTKNVYTTTVPLVVLENMRAQLAVANARLIRVLVLLIILLFASNGAWLWYESQFENVSIEQEVDTGEGDAFVVGNGDLNYGEGEAEDHDP